MGFEKNSLMLKVVILTLCLSCRLISVANAQQEENAGIAIDFLKTACVTGETVELSGDASGGLSILKKGVQGKVYFKKSELRGFLNSLNDEIRRSENVEIRKCMEPRIDRILDYILGGDSKKLSSKKISDFVMSLEARSLACVPSNSRECFILRENASRVGHTMSVLKRLACEMDNHVWQAEKSPHSIDYQRGKLFDAYRFAYQINEIGLSVENNPLAENVHLLVSRFNSVLDVLAPINPSKISLSGNNNIREQQILSIRERTKEFHDIFDC